MPAFLGMVAFLMALFVVGSFMEGKPLRMLGFGAAFLGCAALILMIGSAPHGGYQDCYTDWDARSNATVCD